MLLRKPQIEEECVHFLQIARTSADFLNILSQIVREVPNKYSLESNLCLLLFICAVARKKEPT